MGRHSATYGYTLRAPATWRPVPTARVIALRGTDLTLAAPNGQAFVAVGVEAAGGKTADAAALQGEADRLITSMSLFVSGVISHRSGTTQKALYVVAGARITTAADLSVDVVVHVTVRDGRVYLLIGVSPTCRTPRRITVRMIKSCGT